MKYYDFSYDFTPDGLLDHFVGRTVTSIQVNPDADEGLIITFDDQSKIAVGYSGCEGITEVWVPE